MDGQGGAESHTEGPGKRHSTTGEEGQPPKQIPAWLSASRMCPIQQVPRHYAPRSPLEVLPKPVLLSSAVIWPTLHIHYITLDNLPLTLTLQHPLGH